MLTYEEWHKHYCNDKIIDLKDYLSVSDFSILSKLGVKYSKELMTAREYEISTGELYDYNLEAYPEDYLDYDQDEIKDMKSLKEKDVSIDDYKRLVKITEEINKKYLYNF